MADRYLLVRWPNGAEGAVLESDFGDPEKADNFEGARVFGCEDGSEYDGPTTPEGMARRAEREAEAEREERAEPERTGRRAREEKE